MAENITIPDFSGNPQTINTTDVVNGTRTPRHIDKPWDTLFAPAAVTVTTVATALPAQACRHVMMLAPKANTVPVYVGNAGAQVFPLDPGAMLMLPVKDASMIYVRVASDSPTLYWLAGS